MTQELSFEEAIQRLEQVVRELESGDLPLERGLELFQEGVALAAALHACCWIGPRRASSSCWSATAGSRPFPSSRNDVGGRRV